jgi:hypothetical protein
VGGCHGCGEEEMVYLYLCMYVWMNECICTYV